MKKNILYILLPLLLIVGAFIFTACNQNKPVETEKDSSETGDREADGKEGENNENEGEDQNEGSEGGIAMNTAGAGIDYFEARYDGSISGEIFSYKIEKEGDKFYFTYEDISLPYEEGLRTEIGREVLDELRKIYDELEIEKWNGFHKKDKDVVDGHGFSLSIGFDNGERLSASGYNYSPYHFWEFREKLAELFLPYIEKFKEEERQKIISKGVSGKLNYVMANFMEKNGDSYEITLINNETESYNLSMRIKSKKGEFFEEGDYLYFSVLPLEAIDFDGIKELAEQYNLIEWYGWQKEAKDADKSEWFQISFEFEEGIIDAAGTDHPENYEAFRKEFLERMAKMVENAKEKYGLIKYQE